MKNTGRFLLVTTALVMVIALSITGTVMSHDGRDLKIQEKYYKEMEQEYVQQIRWFLTDSGYENSGVMLTHVVNEDGSREYTVTIHNEKITALSEKEKEALGESVLKLAFDAPDCNFCQEFLNV